MRAFRQECHEYKWTLPGIARGLLVLATGCSLRQRMFLFRISKFQTKCYCLSPWILYLFDCPKLCRISWIIRLPFQVQTLLYRVTRKLITRQHSSRMHTARACQLYVFQLNRFEQVASDDHQMSVVGGGPQVWCPEKREGVPHHVTYPMTHVMYLSPSPGQNDGQTPVKTLLPFNNIIGGRKQVNFGQCQRPYPPPETKTCIVAWPDVRTHRMVLVCTPDPQVSPSSCVPHTDQFPAIHMYLQQTQHYEITRMVGFSKLTWSAHYRYLYSNLTSSMKAWCLIIFYFPTQCLCTVFVSFGISRIVSQLLAMFGWTFCEMFFIFSLIFNIHCDRGPHYPKTRWIKRTQFRQDFFVWTRFHSRNIYIPGNGKETSLDGETYILSLENKINKIVPLLMDLNCQWGSDIYIWPLSTVRILCSSSTVQNKIEHSLKNFGKKKTASVESRVPRFECT